MDRPYAEEVPTAHMRDYLAVLWRRKWICLLVFLVLSAGGLAYVYKMLKPEYVAQSRIGLERMSRLVESRRNFAGETFYNAQYQFIGSPRVAAGAAVKLGRSPSVEMAMDDGTADMIRGAVSISAERENRIVRVWSRQHDPEAAAQLVNAVVDAFIEITAQNEKAQASAVQNDLQGEIVNLATQMEAKKRAIDEFARDKNLIQQMQDQARITAQISALAGTQTRSTVVREQAEESFAEIQAKYDAGEDIGFYQPSTVITSLEARISEYELSRKMMEVGKTKTALSKDPEYIQTIALIGELRNDLEKKSKEERREFNDRQYELARLALEAARKEETRIGEQLSQANAELSALTMGLTELGRYNELKRELEALRGFHDKFKQDLLEARINDDIPILAITIHERAKAPTTPAWPSKTQLAVVVVAMSFLIGAGLAFFLEYMDRTVRKPEDVENELRLPLLGFVPSMPASSRDGTRHGKVTITHPSSGPAESYRKVRAKLFVYKQESHTKVFTVTSTTAGEGKTTLSSNLAIAFAQSGANVLLIDADMRHPKIQSIYDIEWTPGLGEYLAGMHSWESVIRESEVEGLSIIPCGRGGNRSAELLESPRMRELVQSVRDKYDVVVIDTPPVLGVADSTVLCNISDATIFVIQASKNSKWLVKRARMELDAAGAQVVGAVLNRVRSQRGDYYYYHRYYPKKS